VSGRLFDKVWDRHLVVSPEGEPPLLYIDLHLVHEVTSPQAFEGLELAGRAVRRPDLTLATMDHDVPTIGLDKPIADPLAAEQIARLRRNCAAHGITLHGLGSIEQGIVHVIGPQLGLTQPGMTVVCGDSHTSTHGAFGALAFGIGTTEVEHVLATQTLRQVKPAAMAVTVEGKLGEGITAKDLVLGIVRALGPGGGVGSVIEYRGDAIRALSMEGRMTVCNMSIEAGGRCGVVAPDATTFAYLKDRPYAPEGAAFDKAVEAWSELASDAGASFDREVALDAATIAPIVTWGTTPDDALPIDGSVPDPARETDPQRAKYVRDALDYMGIAPGKRLTEIAIDRVFIGSCTNSRIEDLRAAAAVLAGRTSKVPGLVSPGSSMVKRQAEEEGLDRIFRAAGLEWAESGCSMCVGINGDVVASGERCASTTNRNFRGRQGRGARTHLMSPAMVAAAAVSGRLADVRPLLAGREP
jgi:3-isopropylmalate/(R)-2-methylmalate dehydratase large subunit